MKKPFSFICGCLKRRVWIYNLEFNGDHDNNNNVLMIPISYILEKYLGSSLVYTNIVEIMVAALIDISLKEKERIFIG